MASINIYPTRPFASTFSAFLAQGPTALTIVSPFLTPLRGWNSVLQFAKFVLSRGTERLEIITRPPLPDGHGANNPNLITQSEAEMIEAEGVSLKIRDSNLHAKLFYFEFEEQDQYAAFIGSSNFTIGGFERNDEIMVQLRHPEYRPEVMKQVARLSGFGSFPYYIWKNRTLNRKV